MNEGRLHPHHFTPGERRMVNGTEYVLVPLPPYADGRRKRFADMFTPRRKRFADMFTPRSVCGGCPFERTSDCVDERNTERLAICRFSEALGEAHVIVPTTTLPILALEGLLP